MNHKCIEALFCFNEAMNLLSKQKKRGSKKFNISISTKAFIYCRFSLKFLPLIININHDQISTMFIQPLSLATERGHGSLG